MFNSLPIIFSVIIFLVKCSSCFAQPGEILIRTIDSAASFRAMSMPDSATVWITGSQGAVCRSTDGALTFSCFRIPGMESADFRSLYAWNRDTAIIANAGSPARILRTDDGGTNWISVYENAHPDAFIDGVDFWNSQEGICYGDPIDGKLLVLRTDNGGVTWRTLLGDSRPLLVDGEASFAASNSAMRCFGSGRVMIATGGALSRILVSENKGDSWRTWLPPILQGEPSQGIFSFDFKNDQEGIVVGGDHKNDTVSSRHVYFTPDGGKTWHFPTTPTRGYRECVKYISEDTVIAVGPSGVDISIDGGRNWNGLSDEKGMHVLQKYPASPFIFIAGRNGKIIRLSLP